ncbi:MAG: SAM-dependent methyltransferase [Kineosporiaceae bacterium]
MTPTDPRRWLPWERAWRDALYGERGFYRRPEGPAGHFRTASHAAPSALAAAIARLARRARCSGVVDLGAGRGELLAALARHDDAETMRPPLRLHGVDLVERPALLPPRVAWTRSDQGVPYSAFEESLVVAWELLDTVPCPVLEVAGDGRARVVLVEPSSGRERLDGAPRDEDLRWCARWWPTADRAEGARIEVGNPRDAWWSGHVGLLHRIGGGLLLAVDYTHTAVDRPSLGTLSGYRRGRLVPPVPDGSCDVTAHVAIDAVEAAGRTAGGAPGVLAPQHEALRALGVRGDEPGAEEVLDRDGLGGFTWLLQAVGGVTPALG